MAENDTCSVSSTTHVHFSPRFSQSLTEQLTDNSEQQLWEEKQTAGAVIWDDWREASFGWQLIVPYPKYATRRNRPPRPQRYSLAARKGSVRSQQELLGLTDDPAFYPWKESVEPLTYAYLPNNGFYRSSKPGPTRQTREVQQWLEMMQRNSQSAKSMLAKQLRRAAELATESADTDSAAEGTLASAINRARESAPVRKVHGSVPLVMTHDRTAEILQFAAKRLKSQANQLNSSSHGGVVKTHYLRLTSGSQTDCSRTTSCHSGVSRKSGSELSINIADGRRPVTDAYLPNTTRLAIQNKNHQRFEEDLFSTFGSVCKQEALRPLAKLTLRQQKEAEDKGSARETDPESGRKDSAQDSTIPLIPATATVYPPDESCGIRTARSAIANTNLRIEEMRNSPLRSTQAAGRGSRSFFAHKGSGMTLLKNGVLRYTVTK